MGWFNKNEARRKEEYIPELPELPRLPELSELDYRNEPLQQLPSFPSGMTGDKFSRSAIKEAVTGREEDDEERDADEFLEEIRKMPAVPPKRPEMQMTRDIEDEGEIPRHFREAARAVQKAEPVFIRVDKYENALAVFEKTKKKIIEIEKMLKDVKALKEKEQKELEEWENEIQAAKAQIERVDKELFSKIE